ILIGGGLIVALGPLSGSLGRFAALLLPLFLILAGTIRIASFAVYRKPRSPIGGVLLVALGAVWIAGRYHSDAGILSIYGRYWPVLLVLFGIVELIRYYSHPQSSGPTPRLFTPGRLAIIVLIIGSGVIANRVAAKRPSMLSVSQIPGYIDSIRNSLAGRSFSFTDPVVVVELAPGVKITVTNAFGDIRVKGGGSQVRATLTKRVQSGSEDDARESADRVKLIFDRTPAGLEVSTNRDQVDQGIGTDIELEVPALAPLEIASSFGNVKATGLRSQLLVNAQQGQVGIDAIAGDLSVKGSYCDVDVSKIDGDVTISGARRVTVARVQGGVDLTANNGSVEVRDVGGPVRIDAPFCPIVAEGLSQPLKVRTEHASVRLSRTPDAVVEAPYSDVRAENISGDLTIASSHSGVHLRTVAGFKINSEQTSVTAEEIRGPVEIDTSHGEISLKSFYDKVHIKTSFRDVKLICAAEPVADIDVEDDHGEIKLVLPTTSDFNLDAASSNGRVRQTGFSTLPVASRDSITYVPGSGPRIKLRTSFKNIVIQGTGNPAGPLATRADTEP
ncbi:MAG TPA: DUF4097 family beta strand repeat-containing protein, partial [Blastocatellia bacterium]|nr:DUF4097 family beta strand repeat-containing protein [Blastocatellia bacterium]